MKDIKQKLYSRVEHSELPAESVRFSVTILFTQTPLRVRAANGYTCRPLDKEVLNNFCQFYF